MIQTMACTTSKLIGKNLNFFYLQVTCPIYYMTIYHDQMTHSPLYFKQGSELCGVNLLAGGRAVYDSTHSMETGSLKKESFALCSYTSNFMLTFCRL